jgi:hypothetical protein
VPVAGEEERLDERLRQPGRELLQLAGRPRALDHHDELVAADAPQQVLRAQDRAQPLRHLAQQRVTGGVAEAVVDDLEAVEVAEQHADGALRVVLEHARQPLAGEEAVGRTGQAVVQRLVGQLELGLAASGDVLQLHHRPAGSRAGGHGGGGDAHPHLLAVDAAHEAVERLRPCARRAGQAPALRGGRAGAVDDAADAEAGELVLAQAEHAAQRGVHHEEVAVLVEQGAADGGVLERQAPLQLELASWVAAAMSSETSRATTNTGRPGWSTRCLAETSTHTGPSRPKTCRVVRALPLLSVCASSCRTAARWAVSSSSAQMPSAAHRARSQPSSSSTVALAASRRPSCASSRMKSAFVDSSRRTDPHLRSGLASCMQ